MDLQIQGFSTDNTELYKQSLNLRQNVFVEEIGFDKHIEFDSQDVSCLHFILFYNSNPVGIVRCNEVESEFIIDRFCILQEYRKRGLGTLLLKYIILELLPSTKTIKCISTYLSQEFFQQRRFKELVGEKEIGSKKVLILKYVNG